MKRLVLTPVKPLKGHSTYCLVIIDNNKFDSYFTSTIDFSKVKHIDYSLDKPVFNNPWDLQSVKTMSDLLNHPSVVTYTEESHPELFI